MIDNNYTEIRPMEHIPKPQWEKEQPIILSHDFTDQEMNLICKLRERLGKHYDALTAFTLLSMIREAKK